MKQYNLYNTIEAIYNNTLDVPIIQFEVGQFGIYLLHKPHDKNDDAMMVDLYNRLVDANWHLDLH